MKGKGYLLRESATLAQWTEWMNVFSSSNTRENTACRTDRGDGRTVPGLEERNFSGGGIRLGRRGESAKSDSALFACYLGEGSLWKERESALIRTGLGTERRGSKTYVDQLRRVLHSQKWVRD